MRGVIIRLIAGDYTIYDLNTKNSCIAKARGVFRIQGISPKVGDYVEYQNETGTSPIITKIEPRTVDLVRPAICNIDQGFLVFSVKEPELNLNLLDRFLVIFEFSSIVPIIVFNKWDLLDSSEQAVINKIIAYYEKIGYTCLKTSAKLKLVDQLSKYIDNKISVITGQSGVGKSSILQVLDPSLNLKTDVISKALGRGKHTTRHVELIPIQAGWIADTPGFGLVQFSDMTEIDIAHSFKEFFEVSSGCRYNGCLHHKEPDCMVKKSVQTAEILRSRYDNYLLFIEECKSQRKW